MKVLVAGGAGFIGSHLIDALLKEGNQVVCIDNFFIGTKNNLKHLADNPDFVFYEENLTDLEKIDNIFSKEHIEYVFHLAANSDIQASSENPETEYKNTYSTTYTLLECMRIHGVKKMFFASTSAVYGDKNGNSVSEDSGNLRPISYYGGCKLGSEALISSYCHMNDLQVLIFRFPNVIGPRLTHGVIFDFIRKLKNNSNELEILGNGKQSKPYLYVLDLVDAIMKYKDVQNVGIEIYNIGVESQTSVTKIADIICKELQLEHVKYNYTGGNVGWKGDVPVFAYNLDKIHAAGWTAKYTSDEAVALTVQEEVAKCML